MDRYSIGAVVFGRMGADGRLQYVPLMGDAREAALRRAYKREQVFMVSSIDGHVAFSDELVLMCDGISGPRKALTWEEVAWETSGVSKGNRHA